jgi:hypothetical protein
MDSKDSFKPEVEIAKQDQQQQSRRLLKTLRKESLVVRSGITSGDGGPKATLHC